jgi:hypothetical protein
MGSDQSAREAPASAPTTQGRAESGDPARHVPRQAPRYEPRDADTGMSGFTQGFTLFAAFMMMMSGVWNFLEGLAAVIRGSYFVVLPHYAFNMSVRGWGWFHLILGVVVAAAGLALLTDKMWARIVGVMVVAVSLIVNFLYIPYLPVWSIVVIAIDMAVIWALLTPRNRTGLG